MSAPFPCWVAFKGNGHPFAFANANYVSREDFLDDLGEYERIELITDQAERDRLLDVHARGAT